MGNGSIAWTRPAEVRRAGEHVGQPCLRVNAVQFGGFDQGTPKPTAKTMKTTSVNAPYE